MGYRHCYMISIDKGMGKAPLRLNNLYLLQRNKFDFQKERKREQKREKQTKKHTRREDSNILQFHV